MAGTSNTNSNSNQDPFEEFVFRPINEGLGFHSRTRNAAGAMNTATGNTASGLSTSIGTGRATASATSAMGMGNSTFSAPLPRPTQTQARPTAFNIPTYEDDSIAKAQNAVNEILKNLNQKRQMDFLHETEKQKVLLKKSKPFFFAAMLDGMLIVAAFLLSMIAMLTITKVDLFMNLMSPHTAVQVYVATAGLFLSITFVYMTVNRAFMGYTPGEWAFDQRLGEENQLGTMSYIPRTVMRTVVVMLTGFVTLPVLSYLFNKDIAGQLTGLGLFRKPNA